ncbi:MAG: BMP family ABC transporter substrate-binding protein [Magnetovibrionaceae bacterium]
MFLSFTRRTFLGAAAALVFGAGAAALSAPALADGHGAKMGDKLKVGFVYVGPIGDHGWTYQHDKGRLAIEDALGEKVSTTYVESVQEGADAERVVRQLAQDGHDLIFTTSFGFMNPTVKVAKRFPDTKFEHATGYKRSKNVSIYNARFYEGRYPVGQMVGKMTKSNIIGYIASIPIPEVVRGINATALGLRSVNPDAEIRVIWVNSWYDPGKEREAAETLIAQGADVIMQHTDSPAPIQAAEEKGVFAVGQASDMTRFGPKAHLTAIVDDWNPYYIQRAKDVLDGTWESTDIWGGLDSGMVRLSAINDVVPAEVKAMVEETVAKITAKTFHPFTGPIKDQSGKEVVPAGSVMDDGALLGMDWYVEGVVGKLPK